MPNQSTLADWPAIPPVPVPIIPVVPPLAPEPISLLLAPVAPAPADRLPSAPSPPLPPPPLPPPPRPATPIATRLAPPRPVPPPPVEPAVPAAPVAWRPAFAAISGAAILVVAIAITLPLWLVVYRTAGPVSEVLALCMMLLGTFLAGLASWAMLIELRGRVRVGDNPARTGGVWAQVAMLIVALGLFVVAAALSLP